MSLSITQSATVRIVAGQAITNNLLRLLALSPSTSISGSVGNADLAAGAVTPAKTTPGAYFYGALTGTNAYAVTLNPPLTAYADGVEMLGKVGNANTLSAVTLSVNGLDDDPVYHRSGQLLLPGDLPANEIVRFRYNSSRDGGDGGWDVMEVLASATIRPAANVTTGTANAQAVVNVPPLTAYAAGNLLLVKVGTSLTNTAALTLAADGLAARNVKRQDGTALGSQEWVAGNTYLLYDDGTQFLVMGKESSVTVAVVANARNLDIRSGTTAGMVVTADEVILKTADGVPILHSAVNLTIVVNTGAGLNALETGATRTTSTWYYIWLISNGTTIAGVLESAGTGDGAAPGGPDLSNPAFDGYVYKALVGQVRLNSTGAGEVVSFQQIDRRVWIADTNICTALAGATTYAVLAGGDLTNLRAAIPPTARSCSGTFGVDNTTDTGRITLSATTITGTLDGTPEEIGSRSINLQAAGATYNSFGACCPFADLPVRGLASRNIQFKASAATIDMRLNICGYTF